MQKFCGNSHHLSQREPKLINNELITSFSEIFYKTKLIFPPLISLVNHSQSCLVGDSTQLFNWVLYIKKRICHIGKK